jgi:hypothetical protein
MDGVMKILETEVAFRFHLESPASRCRALCMLSLPFRQSKRNLQRVRVVSSGGREDPSLATLGPQTWMQLRGSYGGIGDVIDKVLGPPCPIFVSFVPLRLRIARTK